MKQTIALLFLAGVAAAQDDSYKSLAVGDRVQVTFRSGATLAGTLLAPANLGPLSGSKPRMKAVDVKGGGLPCLLYVFTRKGDASCDAQLALIESWRKDFPEVSVTAIAIDDRTHLELIKTHNIVNTPSLVFKNEANGQTETQIGLQSAERLTGAVARLRARAEEEKVDFDKEPQLTLDVRLEYPGLNGTMSVSKKDIREVRKLQKLDEQTRRRLEEEFKKIKETQKAEEDSRRAAEAKRTGEAVADIEKTEKEEKDKLLKADEVKALQEKAEKMKAQDELLKRFPPDQWNDERKAQILNKSQSKLPITPDERAFLESQADWADAVKTSKAKKEKEAKEKATEEK